MRVGMCLAHRCRSVCTPKGPSNLLAKVQLPFQPAQLMREVLTSLLGVRFQIPCSRFITSSGLNGNAHETRKS